MKTVIKVLTICIAGTAITSCNTRHKLHEGGIIGFSKTLTVGQKVPDVPVLSSRGKQYTLRQLHKIIRIVAFIEGPNQVCCRLESSLIDLSQRFKARSVTVVQISMPANGCPHGLNCAYACGLTHRSLIALCDPERIAWKAYGQPAPNTVFLVDYYNRVAMIETMSNLDSIADEAVELDDWFEFFVHSNSD